MRRAWRFFTGAHLDGRPRTNATWRTRGTLPRNHLTWWTAMPRLHRAAWRNSIFWLSVLTVLGAWKYLTLTLWLYSAALPFVLSKVYPIIRRRMIRRVRVRPRVSDPILIDEGELADHESIIGEIAAETPIDIDAIPIKEPKLRRQA